MKKVILAIDDSAPILRQIHDVLKEDYDVRLAKTAEIAMAVLNGGERISLILLDIRMPDLDGLSFQAQLAKDAKTSEIPIIFITSYATQDVISHAMASGVSDFIVKPFSKDVLINKVDNSIKKASAKLLAKNTLPSQIADPVKRRKARRVGEAYLRRNYETLRESCRLGKHNVAEQTARQLVSLYYSQAISSFNDEVLYMVSNYEYEGVIAKIDQLLKEPFPDEE